MKRNAIMKTTGLAALSCLLLAGCGYSPPSADDNVLSCFSRIGL